MKPQEDSGNSPLTCSICQPKPTRAAHAARVIASLGVALSLTLCAAQLFAQEPSDQPWPPDDSYGNGQPAPIPQYTPDQQYGYNQPQSPDQQPYGQQQGYGPTQQPLSPNDLTQLIAPIALYPDALIAQILAASTYPAQISAADQWRRSLGNAPPEQVAAGADAQTSWDPAIKALTAFPQVLDMMAGNLQWTTALGNAYYNQPQDVMQTIQVMRERAQQAGNLQSTPQEQITDNQGYIGIAPVNPQVVYVPTYNPWAVYGAPVSPYPGFSFFGALGSFFGSSPVQYGLSFAMSAFMHTPWGFLGWGLDWLTHAILFNHNDYWTHSTSVRDWGFPHGGPRAYPGNPQWIHGSQHGGYNRAWSQPASGFNRSGLGRPVGHPIQPTQRWGDARTQEGFNHGFPSRNEGYTHPAMPTQQASVNRQEQFPRAGYGSNFYGQRENYASRSNMAYASPSQSYRLPQSNYQRSGGYSARGYDAYGNSDAWKSQQHSGGFHPFGGGHNSNAFGGSAPKTYSFNGGGHSGWGGSGGWKSPKESHSGGGHSFGGGGHSSGGHSGGGGHGHHR